MTPAMHAHIASLSLARTPILRDIDLQLTPGRWTAIVGPNGAGKSTLLRALAGVHDGDARMTGQISWQGRPLADWPLRERARHVAWLGQAEAGSQDLRAQDVVMLGRLPHQAWLAAPSDADLQAVREAMQSTHCWDWRCRPMGQLSGGERQRVLLARALAVQARVLLMDEPLSHLDPPHQADWLDIVHEQLARGVTVVSVLHELNMALMADELVLMREGRVVHHGPSHDPAAHAALAAVFDGRIRLVELEGQWLALPHITEPRHRHGH
jgi:iron complex transport system ATP-binding protein